MTVLKNNSILKLSRHLTTKYVYVQNINNSNCLT